MNRDSQSQQKYSYGNERLSKKVSLTAELEKLEHTITMTLQEIDRNFSRCHRIITTSILPIIERYSLESSDVWNGSQFWKHFFEMSANVSLSGFEELNDTGFDVQELSNLNSVDNQSPCASPDISVDNLETGIEQKSYQHSSMVLGGKYADESVEEPRWANIPSSFDGMKYEYSAYADMSLRKSQTKYDDTSHLSDGQSQNNQPQSLTQTSRKSGIRREKFHHTPLLHRVLDSNWRIQAKPFDISSPGPRLSDLTSYSTRTSQSPALHPLNSRHVDLEESKPSLSLKSSHVEKTFVRPRLNDCDEESDNEGDGSLLPGGLSPPVTMQFTVPIQRILKTPAKDAAQMLVDEFLEAQKDASIEDIGTPILTRTDWFSEEQSF